MDCPLAIGSRIEDPIGHLLGDRKIDDGVQGRLWDLEITSIVQKHAIETDITLLDVWGRVDAPIFPYLVC